jgi:hypothetical protein
MALPVHWGPRPLIQFRNHFSQTAGLLGRVISPSQGRYLNTGQHQHRINAYTHTEYPCLEWNSNPRSQRQSRRRLFMPLSTQPLWLTLVSRLSVYRASDRNRQLAECRTCQYTCFSTLAVLMSILMHHDHFFILFLYIYYNGTQQFLKLD